MRCCQPQELILGFAHSAKGFSHLAFTQEVFEQIVIDNKPKVELQGETIARENCTWTVLQRIHDLTAGAGLIGDAGSKSAVLAG